jgi:hypothetical protein
MLSVEASLGTYSTGSIGTAVIVGLLVGKVLSGIARPALYLYATRNTAPERFDGIDFSRLQSFQSCLNFSY